ncbi:MAG: carboxymuconolactone decarboxylase family protein [Acidobacteria bacterium]|nr:carboxymuconolactone decarboxylase family protein [Acidobacteriota bacterium]
MPFSLTRFRYTPDTWARLTIVCALAGMLLLQTPSAVSGQGASSGGARLESDGTLPRDVYQDSLSRLPLIKREDMNEQGKKAYDAAAANSPTGRPEGVAAIRLHRSGVDVRWDSSVGRRLTELAIITAAREHDQPYEWSLHEMEALSVGLEPDIIDRVRHRRPLTGLGDREAAIVQFGRELSRHRVTSDTYARALKLFGKTDLVDVVDLMAQYAGTAVNLTAANQWMPPQMKQFLPLPFSLPNDILPDSRSRIPAVNPNQPPAQAQPAPAGLYRRTLAPPPTGPGSMGRFAAGLTSLESSQGRALMALAVLITAREHDEQYDWTRNEASARRDGLDPAVIDIVRLRKPLTGLGEKEAILIQFGRELFGRHNVTAETYARAKQVFGQRDLSDFVVGLMAQHAREAALLTAFDQHLPPGQTPQLPIP